MPQALTRLIGERGQASRMYQSNFDTPFHQSLDPIFPVSIYLALSRLPGQMSLLFAKAMQFLA
jgi:hypothetical protein